MNDDLRRCPYCAEVIKMEAVKCKHCGSNLPHSTSAEAAPQVATPDSVSNKSGRRAFWIASFAMVAVFVGLFTLMISGPSKSEMESHIRDKMQNHVATDSYLRAYKIEITSVELLKSGSNTYEGLAVAKFEGNEHNIPLQITIDGSRYMWKWEPLAFAFVARAELKEFANELGETMMQAEEELVAMFDSADGSVASANKKGAKTRAATEDVISAGTSAEKFSDPWLDCGSDSNLENLVIASLQSPASSYSAAVEDAIQDAACVIRSLGEFRALRWEALAEADTPGKITVAVEFQNGAMFAQPFPVIRVSLEDRFGRHLAVNDVSPTDYMNGDSPDARVPAGGKVRTTLLVPDPMGRAEGFRVEFCLKMGAEELVCSGTPTEAPSPPVRFP